MRHLVQICAVMCGVGLTTPVSAADLAMPVKAAPAYVAPSYTWTGCYFGGLGGAWARKHYFDPLADPLAVPPEFDLGSHTASGFVGGGQAGCDYQAGAFVFGARGSIDWSNLHAEHLAFGDFYATRIPWFATVTGRIGYTLLPNLLAYVQGGAAWVRDRETKTDLVTGLVEGTAEVTRSGWTVGGGLEFMFAPNWSVFAEY